MRLPLNPKFPLNRVLAGLAAAAAITVAVAHTGRIAPAQELAWLNHLANSGDAGAELQLGLAYREGRYGLQPDARASLRWLTEAGRNGDAYAADLVANAYATGEDVTRDPQAALRWWRLAAKGGNGDAQAHLGEALLARGDRNRALTWIRDAADRGNQRAHRDLTRLYHQQALPDADLHRGENAVAALSERLDATGVNALFAAWETIESSSPITQTAEALEHRAEQGDPVAEYQLAMRYLDGAWAVKRDPKQAASWLRRSAAAGNRVAAQTLADTGLDEKAGLSATPPPGAALPASAGGSRT